MDAWDERGIGGVGPGKRGRSRGGTRVGRARGGEADRRGGLARVLGDGEDPLAWSITVFRSGLLHVRAHLVVLMMVVAELVLASASDRIGPLHVALATGALLGLVLVRELGRWLIVRSMEPEPAPIVLWPLGSLSPTPWLGSWRRELVATAGGLTVNMLLWPVLAIGLYAGGLGWDAFVFNPFRPSAVLVGIGSVGTAALWWLYYMNAVLVGVHVLLPMLPMDAGRVLEVVLRARLLAGAGVDRVGGRATWLAARAGLVTALALFVGGMSSGQTRLMGLAVFGAAVCWTQMRRVQFAHDPARPDCALREEPVNDYSVIALDVLAEQKGPALAGISDRGAGPVFDEDSAAIEASMEAVLDAVLAKISRSGLASLSEDERMILKDATRERGGGGCSSDLPPKFPLR